MAHRTKPKGRSAVRKYNQEHAVAKRKREEANKPDYITRKAWVGKGVGIKNKTLTQQYSYDGGKTWSASPDRPKRKVQEGMSNIPKTAGSTEADIARHESDALKINPPTKNKGQNQGTNGENNQGTNEREKTKENNKTKEPKISERQQRIKKLEELSNTDRRYIPTTMDVESGATGGAKTWKQSQQYKKYQRMLRKLREDEKKGG